MEDEPPIERRARRRMREDQIVVGGELGHEPQLPQRRMQRAREPDAAEP